MDGLKTWTSKAHDLAIVVTAETVELAIRNIKYELGVDLTATDLLPLPTHHRHVRLIPIRPVKTRSETGYKGVSCVAFFKHANKSYHLGSFSCPEDAREAYERECERHNREPVGRGYSIKCFIRQPNGRILNLGSFETLVEAAKAYDEAATRFYGDKAVTNRSLGLL